MATRRTSSSKSDAFWRERARRTLVIEAAAVSRLAARLDGDFVRAARLISSCTGRVAVMGIGKSGLIGRKLAATLSSVGTPAFFVHPTEGMHGDLGMLSKKDLVLAVSYSGETEELRKILTFVDHRGLPLVAMTGRPQSALGRAADVVVDVAVEKEACPYNITPTASTTATLAAGDALALLIMEMKGFSLTDFAKLHPGGALGKRLTLRVKDIMHTGKENPLVGEEKKVQEALQVMTDTRLGAASVVDKKGKLVGVFTDGDLRRRLQTDPQLLGKPLKAVMTRNPKTLAPDMLAHDAAGLFRQMRLDNFPVVDKSRRPLGVLDEKDLLDEGLL